MKGFKEFLDLRESLAVVLVIIEIYNSERKQV